MQQKLFYVRDGKCTRYAVLCTKFISTTYSEKLLLNECGFGNEFHQIEYMFLHVITVGTGHKVTASYDAFAFNDNLLRDAHFYINKNWVSLVSGQTITLDVEY